MVQKGVVDHDWVPGVREGGEPGGFSWGDQLLGRPDVVRGGLRKEIGPVGAFSSVDGFEIAELGLSCNIVGVGGQEFLALREAFANSLRRVVSCGVHLALDFGDGCARGAVASIVAMRVEEAEENPWSSWLGEGFRGGGGMSQSLSLFVRPGQSASCQRGRGLWLWGEGGAYGNRNGGVV